jgi:8-oxo-dGTP pyrophosphatase MutT (NUDIX family)/broad specificity phosphatase PhoE
VRAAGAVLWRPAGSSAEVAVIHRPRYDDWSLPKGKLDPGEHPLVAACREVVEETGVAPVVGPRLPTIDYMAPSAAGPVQKTVDYWAMRAASDDHDFTPNREVDEVHWLPPAQARSLLTYDHDRPLVDAFAALHPITATVLLIRHGRAGTRNEWTGDDRLRPLDAAGQAEAVRIAHALSWFAPERIITAHVARCVQSVEPLAAALGVDVEIDPVFSEELHTIDQKRASEQLRELAATGAVIAVCSQGAVIPATVALLAGTNGVVIDEIESDKGSVWVLSFRGTTLVAADYLPGFGA